ncbi:MAG: cytochrome c biogenesis protein [Planctomycetota bacterium]
MNPHKKLFAFLLPLTLGAGPLAAQDSGHVHERAEPWDTDICRVAERIPLQEGGRIKPLSVLARWMLVASNGKSSIETDTERLSPIEWMLDCLFYPMAAWNYEMFRIQTSEVLDALELPHEGKRKRDWYSYANLMPKRERLFDLAGQYDNIDSKQRTTVQQQVIELAQNVWKFEHIFRLMSFTRDRVPAGGSEFLKKQFAGRSEVPLHEALGALPAVREHLRRLEATKGSEAERTALTRFREEVAGKAMFSDDLALFPPSVSVAEQGEWMSPRDIVTRAVAGEGLTEQIAMLASLERMTQMVHEPELFRQELQAFQGQAQKLAESRGEYAKVGMEITFYRADFMFYSLLLFILSFVLVAVSWLRPQGKLLYRIVQGGLWLSLALLITGIVFRCVIRGRPPVSTLYETIPFMTAVAVIVALVMEFINRQRIGQALAAAMGALGLFLAHRYELMEGVDTMPSLVAVLDTNFWLATHVTTVTMGYAAGLLAAAIAHVYILGRLFGLKRGNERFYRDLARMVYGVICFGLLFSVVGTILGGVWANYSWGRFWGWDPKENGALLIVLWELAILHGRMGGYLRNLGLCIAAVFGACVVAFSWWGVNQLGVGLHSYGFTDGIVRNLIIFGVFETLVVGAGFAVFMMQRAQASAPVATLPPEVPREPVQSPPS